MVLRSRPRWRAIAEIVQPWRANACASMSSSRDSMGTRGSFESACGQRPPSSKEPRPFPDGATGWGISVSRTGEIHLSANQMVTEVRQRVTRERLGRRGTTAERTWTHRQLLLTGYEHLSTKQVARLRAALAAEDLTNEIGAAHAVKERLRLLLNASDPARDQVPALRLLQRRRGLPHGRDRPAGQDDRHLVASHPDGAD